MMRENEGTSARLGHVLRLSSTRVGGTIPTPSESSVMLCGMRDVDTGIRVLLSGDVLSEKISA